MLSLRDGRAHPKDGPTLGPNVTEDLLSLSKLAISAKKYPNVGQCPERKDVVILEQHSVRMWSSYSNIV